MIFKRRTKAIKLESLDQLDELTGSGQPVFIDFWRTNCQSCRTMEGVVDELAHEYRDSAHVVKVDVGSVPGAAERFQVRSTPTFVLLGRSQKKRGKKSKRESDVVGVRWRASGLVKKDQLARVLESNGAKLAG